VAYDEDLAHRIRELLAGRRGVTEKAMFGGLAFLVGGNMAIAASGQGGVLVRVDPEQSQRLVSTTKAETAVMRGRPMAGWLRVADEHVRTKAQLAKWVERGADYAGSLPAKKAKK
jgi:TfoX/Sxy family transcriptional regulator of competence genes